MEMQAEMDCIDAIVRRLVPQVAAAARVHPAQVDPDTHLVIELGLSSLDLLSALAWAEAEFCVRFPDESLPELTTVRGIAKAVLHRRFESER